MWILLLLYWKKVSCKTSYKNHISIFLYLVSNSEGFLWSISLKDRVLSRQYAVIDTVDPGFNKHDLYRILRYIEQNLSVPLFLTTKSLIQNLSLTNTPFNKFLIISNKNIGFLIKFYPVFTEFICNLCITEICRISDACSSSKVEPKIFSFKCFVVSNYIVVTITI